MIVEKLLNKNNFDSFIAGLKKQGYKTIAPKKDNKLVMLDEIQDDKLIVLFRSNCLVTLFF